MMMQLAPLSMSFSYKGVGATAPKFTHPKVQNRFGDAGCPVCISRAALTDTVEKLVKGDTVASSSVMSTVLKNVDPSIQRAEQVQARIPHFKATRLVPVRTKDVPALMLTTLGLSDGLKQDVVKGLKHYEPVAGNYPDVPIQAVVVPGDETVKALTQEGQNTESLKSQMLAKWLNPDTQKANTHRFFVDLLPVPLKATSEAKHHPDLPQTLTIVHHTVSGEGKINGETKKIPGGLTALGVLSMKKTGNDHSNLYVFHNKELPGMEGFGQPAAGLMSVITMVANKEEGFKHVKSLSVRVPKDQPDLKHYVNKLAHNMEVPLKKEVKDGAEVLTFQHVEPFKARLDKLEETYNEIYTHHKSALGDNTLAPATFQFMHAIRPSQFLSKDLTTANAFVLPKP
ncbi:MAG: hypothetical protein ACKO37_09785 [Vampirovibrionales bacterium]